MPGLLIPRIFAPVLTIRGVMTREGVAQVVPLVLDTGLHADTTVNTLKSMMNPAMVWFLAPDVPVRPRPATRTRYITSSKP